MREALELEIEPSNKLDASTSTGPQLTADTTNPAAQTIALYEKLTGLVVLGVNNWSTEAKESESEEKKTVFKCLYTVGDFCAYHPFFTNSIPHHSDQLIIVSSSG